MPKLLNIPFRMLWNKPGEEKSSPCGSFVASSRSRFRSIDGFFFSQLGASWSERASILVVFADIFLFPPKNFR